MNRKIFYFSLLSVAVASCSTVNNKQALGDFEYAKKQPAQALEIPSGLEKPKKHSKFEIPAIVNKNGPIGENVDVRSPSLVLPIAASTRTEPKSSKAKVWFDQVIDDVDLKAFVVEALTEQLALDKVAMKAGSNEDTYESDWYHSEVEEGMWFFKTIESSESIRYRYNLSGKPHGRSVALTVELLDYMKTDKTGGSKDIDVIERQRVEMAMLNQIISQVDYKYRLKQQENRLLRANKKFVTIGESVASEPSYIVEISEDLLWSNLPLFFDTYGFTVSDLNETDRIYYVDYVKPTFSFWDTIWGDDFPVIDLADGKYQFKLAENEDTTSVTIYNEQGTPLTTETLTDIFDVMEPGLSFKDAF